jgi:hypothetical protein
MGTGFTQKAPAILLASSLTTSLIPDFFYVLFPGFLILCNPLPESYQIKCLLHVALMIDGLRLRGKISTLLRRQIPLQLTGDPGWGWMVQPVCFCWKRMFSE